MGNLEQVFESALKEVVLAKRLSASKMGKLTELAMKAMENDTQLVSILYRTHKTLPTASKVSSLYAFDALSRAARSQVNKHGLTGDINSEKGNCATFLLKVEGVLDGLFNDLISTGSPETKEKSQKILDIWAKANTFPPFVLTGLSNIMKGAGKEPELAAADPRMPTQPTGSTAPPTATTSASAPVPLLAPIPPNTDAVQSTLLALLSKASTAAATSNNGQTTPNTILPQLDSSQLALLQQLTQTAKLVNDGSKQGIPHMLQPAPPPPLPPPIGAIPPSRDDYQGSSSREPRYEGHGSPSRHDDFPPSRGGFRGGFRGRGRGDGRPRWDDRDRFGRERSPPFRGGRRSRSRSPPSRYGPRNAYSPPRRPEPSIVAPGHVPVPPRQDVPETDEFGRDVRPGGVGEEALEGGDRHLDQKGKAPSVGGSVSVSMSPPLPAPPPLPPTAAAPSPIVVDPPPPPEVKPMSPLTGFAQSPASASGSAPGSVSGGQVGLDRFDITAFDLTSPASWEALGRMWTVTNGYPPSQEALMQFVMAQTAGAVGYGGSSGEQVGWGGSGWGGERAGGPRFVRGDYAMHTDAVVLSGEGSTSLNSEEMADGDRTQQVVQQLQQHQQQPQQQTNVPTQGRTVGSGGRMQRVGDRWVFVRDTA